MKRYEKYDIEYIRADILNAYNKRHNTHYTTVKELNIAEEIRLVKLYNKVNNILSNIK